MSDGDIFYTQLDDNLVLELNKRGEAGRFSRTTADLNYMITKIANVSIVPYEVDYRKTGEKTDDGKSDKVQETRTEIKEAILGGITTRTGEYLPSGPDGFLTDRKYTLQSNSFKDVNNLASSKTESFFNTSRRIPPYLTSADISIGDNAMGMMNTANANFTIPNPGKDLEFFEYVYLRPGRHVTMIFEHPETAILSETKGLLSSSISSITLQKELSTKPDELDKFKQKYGKMNKMSFDGVIVSFQLDYQSDGTVSAAISMRGASQLYTDVSMYLDSDQKETKEKTKEEQDAQNTQTQTAIKEIVTLYDTIDEDFNNVKKQAIDGFNMLQDNDKAYIWGSPYAGASQQRYITLAKLIEFINNFITTKLEKVTGQSNIICTSNANLCRSILYPNIVSPYPMDMFIPKYCSYDIVEWFKSYKSNLDSMQTISDKILPARLFINLAWIKTTLDGMKQSESYDLTTFMNNLSIMIYKCSGGAIDMKLLTHPDPIYQNSLLFYDSNNVLPSAEKPVEPYTIPIFANSEKGTIVRDFKFSGKLPTDASNLSYVMNQDPSNISEAEIAPFLAYMYAANKIVRSGNLETKSMQFDQVKISEMNNKFKQTHESFLKALQDAKISFGYNISDVQKQIALSDALKKHIQYPTATIQDANQLKAPVIPFDCSFTIDGINGFKYGNVLQISGLPARFTDNAVFLVVSVTHNVTTQGEWTTEIRCIMRPKIT